MCQLYPTTSLLLQFIHSQLKDDPRSRVLWNCIINDRLPDWPGLTDSRDMTLPVKSDEQWHSNIEYLVGTNITLQRNRK